MFKNGIKKNAIALVTIINKKKKVKILSINFFPSSEPSFIFVIKKGINTETETIDPTVINIKSGILKAA